MVGRPRGSFRERPVEPSDVAKFLANYSEMAINSSGKGLYSVFGDAVAALEHERSSASTVAYHRWWHNDIGGIRSLCAAERDNRRSKSMFHVLRLLSITLC